MNLLVVKNGRERFVATMPLRDGAEGNLQTLHEMIPMVREDAQYDIELRMFVESLVTDCRERDENCEIGKVFDFARSIHFMRDPIDLERIADAATTRADKFGDCGDLAILIATMLGSIGYVCRLVAVNWIGDLVQHGYDHIYPEVQLNDATWLALDATPEDARPGQTQTAPVMSVFEIWPSSSGGVGGLLDQLIGQGVQLGSQYAAGAIQQGKTAQAQADQIGRQFDSLDKQLANYLVSLNAASVISADQWNAALQTYATLAQFAQQYQAVAYVAKQWASEGPRYETWFQGLQAKVAAAAAAAATSTSGGTTNALGSATASVATTLNSVVTSITSSPVALVVVAGFVVWLISRGD